MFAFHDFSEIEFLTNSDGTEMLFWFYLSEFVYRVDAADPVNDNWILGV